MSSRSRLLRLTFSTAADPAKTISLKSVAAYLFKERDIKKVVELFKKSSESERFRANTGIYKSTVRRLATAKQFRLIEEILEHQKQYKEITREGFAVRLIALYGKSGMFDHASKLFDELPELKCERTVQSFNAILGACVNSKKFDKVDGYFRELPEKLDVKPNVVSYTMLIKAFCEMGSLDAAVSALDEMEKDGLEPDLVTFNVLLHAFYEKNQNRFDDGEKMWFRMERNNIVPDIRSYNAKLVGLVCEKRLSEAAELIDEFVAKGIKPDAFSYTALVKGHCEDGNMEEVKRWYGEFSKNGCVPMKGTFATVIPFAREKGDLAWAFELCKESFDRRCVADLSELQLVVDCLVKESNVKDAKKLVQLGYHTRKNLKLPSEAITQETSTVTE